MPRQHAPRLYGLLDSLEALRLEFANATEGEKAVIATHGLTKLREVRKLLDTAIQTLKLAIDALEGPPPKARAIGRKAPPRRRKKTTTRQA